jgi:hypothetical protein
VNDTRADGVSEYLASIGVDGLFTDDPSGLIELFATIKRPGQRDPR